MKINKKHLFKQLFSKEHYYSLKKRLLFSALLMITIMLPVIGLTLNSAFDKQLKTAMENELKAYSYSILAVAEVESNQLVMPEQLLENQFNVIQSGLYAAINSNVNRDFQVEHPHNYLPEKSPEKSPENLWQSPSLLSVNISQLLSAPPMGQSSIVELTIGNRAHLVYSISASFSDNEKRFPITLHIIKDQSEFLTLSSEFKQQLWIWLILLMVLFITLQIIWLGWTLKPLTTLSKELNDIEKGQRNYLQHIYPIELQQVTIQLNTLLTTEQNQRKRYRNALSDLAHSLKTPLAVIQTQQDLSKGSIEQLTRISQMIEHQLKRAQSAGESSWHLGISVEQVASKLIKTLNKIYQHKGLNIHCDLASSAIFKGDEADLMEILGNLLDNACKAANKQVSLDVIADERQLSLIVCDDGSGIEESKRQVIFDRGTRVDTYQQGHGIGLAIVRDLVESYQGKMTIETSEKLNGAKFSVVFTLK